MLYIGHKMANYLHDYPQIHTNKCSDIQYQTASFEQPTHQILVSFHYHLKTHHTLSFYCIPSFVGEFYIVP